MASFTFCRQTSSAWSSEPAEGSGDSNLKENDPDSGFWYSYFGIGRSLGTDEIGLLTDFDLGMISLQWVKSGRIEVFSPNPLEALILGNDRYVCASSHNVGTGKETEVPLGRFHQKVS